MKIKFIEQWKFRLAGRAVPVIKVADIGPDGKVLSLQDIGNVKLRPNSHVNTWDEKGWEIESENPGYLTRIDEKGIPHESRVVSVQGRTVDLYIHPYFKPGISATYQAGNATPNREDIVGHAATMDDIADSMDLGKSMRNILIGGILSAPVWWIIFQMLGAMAK